MSGEFPEGLSAPLDPGLSLTQGVPLGPGWVVFHGPRVCTDWVSAAWTCLAPGTSGPHSLPRLWVCTDPIRMSHPGTMPAWWALVLGNQGGRLTRKVLFRKASFLGFCLWGFEDPERPNF